MRQIEIMMAAEAAALCAEQAIPITHSFLPLGGSAFTQLAILMIIGFLWGKISG